MRSRSEFLKASPLFPPAKTGWSDVRTFSGEGWVAGRVLKSDAGWVLSSGGESLAITIDEPILEGDLIAVRIDSAPGTELSAVVSESVLLFGGEGRYEDEHAAFTIARSEQWALFVSAVRLFFLSRGFIEAQTPTLVPSPGTEPFLDPFTTEWFFGSHKRQMFLPTSPEFHLKQMLVRGWTRIFEIKPCFRNGEIGEHHQPEFMMLEWYRAYANLDSIAEDVDQLLQAVAQPFSVDVPKLARKTIAQLFAQAFDGFQLEPTTSREELRNLAAKYGVETREDDSFDDIFFRLFLEKIESSLGQEGPLLVSHYPPSQAALSRLGSHGFAERFEVYWNGLELANAFHELNDPDENERRFAQDYAAKLALGKTPVPRDENLVRQLQKGMPPSGGIALGIDRLFMALFGVTEIAATRAFPVIRPG